MGVDTMNEDLFQKLSEWRLRKAKELKVPAYVIFHNSTLIDICESKIYQKTDLLQIKGIGPKRIEEYGDEITKLIQDYYEHDHNEIIDKLDEKERKEIVPKQKRKKVKVDLGKKKVISISIDKITEQRIKSHLKGRASEMVVKYTFINSGYSVLRGERWLNYHLTKKPEWFRDKDQINRLLKCVSLCKKNSVGLPDFFVYSDSDEFFLEVKSNESILNQNQLDVFPKINKIIQIKIIRVNMNFRMRSLGITLDDYE